jgi:MraZ protein
VVPDKLGRIVVPQYLRSYAELGTEVVIAGVYDRIEVWDKAAWADQNASLTRSVPDIAAALGA